jgi:hypothetical protein
MKRLSKNSLLYRWWWGKICSWESGAGLGVIHRSIFTGAGFTPTLISPLKAYRLHLITLHVLYSSSANTSRRNRRLVQILAPAYLSDFGPPTSDLVLPARAFRLPASGFPPPCHILSFSGTFTAPQYHAYDPDTVFRDIPVIYRHKYTTASHGCDQKVDLL